MFCWIAQCRGTRIQATIYQIKRFYVRMRVPKPIEVLEGLNTPTRQGDIIRMKFILLLVLLEYFEHTSDGLPAKSRTVSQPDSG
jgi:hypothetical protein